MKIVTPGLERFTSCRSGWANFRNTPSREGDNEERYICRVNNLAESGVARHST